MSAVDGPADTADTVSLAADEAQFEWERENAWRADVPAEFLPVANEEPSMEGEADANAQMRWERRVDSEIDRLEAEHRKIVEGLRQEIADADAWLNRQTAPLYRLRQLIHMRLTDWFDVWLESHPKGKRSVELVAGEIRSRAGRVSVVVDDERAAVVWLETHAPFLLRLPAPPAPQVDKAALQKAVVVLPEEGDDLQAVLNDGVIIPGVHLSHGARTVEIRPNKPVNKGGSK